MTDVLVNNPPDQINFEYDRNKVCYSFDDNYMEYKKHYIFIYLKKHETQINKFVLDQNIQDNDLNKIIIEDNTNIQDTITNIFRIFDEYCNNKNIIVIMLTNFNFSDKFNKYQTTITTDKKYNNVIIFSLLNDLNIYNYLQPSETLNNNNKYKLFFKVINIRYSLHPPEEYYSDEITREYNSKPCKFIVIIQYTHEKEIFKMLELLIPIIEEKFCSSGKLIQFVGTCWLNSILNSLLLPVSTREIIINKCKKYVSNNTYTIIPLNDLCIKKDEVTPIQIVISIIYYFYIIKQYPKNDKTNNSDYVLLLATKLKSEWYSKKISNNYCNNKGYEKTNDTKIKDEYTDFNDNGGDGHDFRETYIFFNTHFFDNKLYVQNTEKLYDKDKKICKTILETTSNTSASIFLNICIEYCIRNHKIYTNIKDNTNTYSLTSSFIVLNDNHAVCGFLCNNNSYIFNSNKFTSIKFDWMTMNMPNDDDTYIEPFPFSENESKKDTIKYLFGRLFYKENIDYNKLIYFPILIFLKDEPEKNTSPSTSPSVETIILPQNLMIKNGFLQKKANQIEKYNIDGELSKVFITENTQKQYNDILLKFLTSDTMKEYYTLIYKYDQDTIVKLFELINILTFNTRKYDKTKYIDKIQEILLDYSLYHDNKIYETGKNYVLYENTEIDHYTVNISPFNQRNISLKNTDKIESITNIIQNTPILEYIEKTQDINTEYILVIYNQHDPEQLSEKDITEKYCIMIIDCYIIVCDSDKYILKTYDDFINEYLVIP
jgi:hypothetical protein